MTAILAHINRFVWGIPALALILGVGIWLSIRTGFVQLRLFPEAIGELASKFRRRSSQEGGVSAYQTLCTALAATVGTGNIAGVAGAIALGGPGAVFWMWICALFGMVTKFAEATLAAKYQFKGAGGQCMGGPMYIIEQGMGKRWKWLAGLYCFFGVIAAFGVGNATQINAVIDGVNTTVTSFGGAPSRTGNILLGGMLAVVVAMMLSGGAKRIGAAAERLVPFASVAYILLGVGVLFLNLSRIPGVLRMIVHCAFSPKAVTGGMVGSALTALRIGISRGVFTNEAGMGTAAISYANAQVSHPVKQGLMGIVEVFLDTVVICTVTALVILCSGVEISYGIDEGAALTTRAFSAAYGSWVGVALAAFLCCFSFATMLGWGLYGARCAQYLLGENAWKPFVWLQAVVVMVSSVLKTGTVWMLAETINGLMVIPNLIALAYLSPVLVSLVKDYRKKRSKTFAAGGTYESFNQCEPLRTLSYEKVPSSCGRSGKKGKENLSSEYRSA